MPLSPPHSLTSRTPPAMSERTRLTISDAEAAASSLASLFGGPSNQEVAASTPQLPIAKQRSVLPEIGAAIAQASPLPGPMITFLESSAAPVHEDDLLRRILGACSNDLLARLGLARIAQPAAPLASLLPASPPPAAGTISSPPLARPSSPLVSPEPTGAASTCPSHEAIENVKRLVREEVAHKAWPDDPNSFCWVNGVKYRSSMGTCVADLKCSFTGCPGRRTLTVFIATPSSYSWTIKAHSDHSVHVTKKRPTEPEVKKIALTAASCGGKPASIAKHLLEQARQKNESEGSGPVLAHQTMTTKQIQNLKYRSEEAKMPPARSFEELVRHYQSEVYAAMVVPFRIPMIATLGEGLAWPC